MFQFAIKFVSNITRKYLNSKNRSEKVPEQ